MGKKGGGRVRVKQVGPKVPAVMNPMDALQIPPEEMIRLPPQPDRKYQVIWPIRKFFLVPSYNNNGSVASTSNSPGVFLAV